jgi:antitoxin CcdA
MRIGDAGMNSPFKPDGTKRPTNVSLNEELVAEAKKLGINVSQACEHGLAEKVKKSRREKWLSENKDALDWSNDYVEKHGLPLARFRMF